MKEYKYIYIKGKRMYLHVHLIHTYVAIEDLKPFDSIFKIWIQIFFFPLLVSYTCTQWVLNPGTHQSPPTLVRGGSVICAKAR